MEKNRPRPDVNVRAKRAKPYGLEPSPEGALPFQHGGSAPCAVSKAVKAKSERERIREALRSTGLLSEMGEEWNDLIAQSPRMTHDEIQQMMAGTPPLSELIIAEREEGR